MDEEEASRPKSRHGVAQGGVLTFARGRPVAEIVPMKMHFVVVWAKKDCSQAVRVRTLVARSAGSSGGGCGYYSVTPHSLYGRGRVEDGMNHLVLSLQVALLAAKVGSLSNSSSECAPIKTAIPGRLEKQSASI